MGVVGFDWEPGFNRIIDIKCVSFESIQKYYLCEILRRRTFLKYSFTEHSSMVLPDELCLTSIRLWGQLDQSMQGHFDIREVFQGSKNKRYTNLNKVSRSFF